VVRYTYDAWGNLLSTTGSLASTIGVLNPIRYRGYVYDSETQLYYLQSRYYDPEIGRFINADAFASTGQGFVGYNMFSYCINNPTNYYDPNGASAFLPTTVNQNDGVNGLFGGRLGTYGSGTYSTTVPVDPISFAIILFEDISQFSEKNQNEKKDKKDKGKKQDPEPPDVTYPGDDPRKAPDGYVWKGKGEQGSKEGGYANPNGIDSWHPDLNHPDGIKPHWDYNDGMGRKWRVFPNWIEFVK